MDGALVHRGSIGGDIESIDLGQLAAFYGGQRPELPLPARERPALKEPGGSNGFAIAPANTAGGHALLTALAGPDPRDEATKDAGLHATDYTRLLDKGALAGERLGVVRGGLDSKEYTLLQLGYAFEQASRARRAPTFPRSVSVGG